MTPHQSMSLKCGLPWFTWFAGYCVSSWVYPRTQRVAAAGSYVKKNKNKTIVSMDGLESNFFESLDITNLEIQFMNLNYKLLIIQ